jgi:hypothetical protein
MPLMMGYMSAWMLGMNQMTFGPMLSWQQHVEAPSLHLEIGFGPSLYYDWSGDDSGMAYGTSLIAGGGFRFTPRVGLMARVYWSPDVANRSAGVPEGDLITAGVMLEISR